VDRGLVGGYKDRDVAGGTLYKSIESPGRLLVGGCTNVQYNHQGPPNQNNRISLTTIVTN